MNPIGIMQGRLSPPKGGRIQSFPVETWREEFSLAREAGLDCIEWVYEVETEEANPLRTVEGIREIHQQVATSRVVVLSVCADYFMREHLVAPDGEPRNSAVRHLKFLLERVGLLGASYVVLPFVDSSSLNFSPQQGLLQVLEVALPVAKKFNLQLHLETDLEAGELAKIMEEFSHPLLKVNYDIGNSAALGRDPVEEITFLAPWLGSVHVKDRLLGGGTVPLGTGAADFATSFRLLHTAGYQGPFVLQTAREENLSELDLAVRNRRFVEEQLALAMKAPNETLSF